MRDEFEDIEIGQRLPRCLGHLLDYTDASFGVDEGSFLFAPAGSRQNEVRHFCRLGVSIHVLHDKKVEPIENVAALVLINPGVRGVRANDPQPFDFSAENALNNFVVGPTILSGDRSGVDVENIGNLFSMFGIGEVMSAQQIARVAEEPRTHRVALTGYGIRTGTGSANIASHQGEVDNRLRRANALIALIDSHRPPEGNTLATVDGLGESVKLFCGQSRLTGNTTVGEWRNKFGELGKFVGGSFNKPVIDPVVLDENASDAVE